MYQYIINTTPPRAGILANVSITIQNLTKCTDYKFLVNAFNSVGDGPKTNMTAATQYESKLHFSWLQIFRARSRI